jgi:hypothetical protein
MNELQRRNCFLFNKDKMVVIIDDDMLKSFLFVCFHFILHDFWFFVPKYCDLVFAKLGLIENWLPHIFGLGFAKGLFMTSLLYLFQHCFGYFLNENYIMIKLLMLFIIFHRCIR